MQLIDLSTIFLNIPWMGVLHGSSLALTWSRDPTCPSKHTVILLTFSVVHSWCIISTKIFEAPVAASLATHCRSIARSFLAIEGTEVKLSGKHRKPILKGSNRHDTHMGIQRSMNTHLQQALQLVISVSFLCHRSPAAQPLHLFQKPFHHVASMTDVAMQP